MPPRAGVVLICSGTFCAGVRLRLRRPDVSDADWLFESYASDEEVTKYLTWAAHADRGETVAFLERCEAVWRREEAFPWVIALAAGNVPVGMAEIRIRPPRVDVGYVLARAHWGHGYMTEVVLCLKEWSLSQQGISRFWTVCDVENVASRRVLEKAGLSLEGILRGWEYHPGAGEEARDCLSFSTTTGDERAPARGGIARC